MIVVMIGLWSDAQRFHASFPFASDSRLVVVGFGLALLWLAPNSDIGRRSIPATLFQQLIVSATIFLVPGTLRKFLNIFADLERLKGASAARCIEE